MGFGDVGNDEPTAPTGTREQVLFRALPGAGAVFSARLVVAFGEQRERFPDAMAVQKYVGVAPVTERSGNKSWVQ